MRSATRHDRNAKRAIKGLQVEGKRGPAGPPGAAGDPGQPGTKGTRGERATRLWAVLNGAGSLARGSGVAATSKLGPPAGSYEVLFNRDVANCSYQATQSRIQEEALVQPCRGEDA